jgi:hypothetical protein
MLMINEIFLRLYEAAQGKKLAVLFSESTSISERTWRKPLSEIGEKTIAKAKKNSLQSMRLNLANRGYPQGEIEDWIGSHPGIVPQGRICAGLIYECQTAEMVFPHTLKYAGLLDELSVYLYEARCDNDLEGFKMWLLDHEAGRIWRRVLNSDEGERRSVSDVLEWIQSARDWGDLDQPFKFVAANCIFSLMACWDVEFTSQYFTSFIARSSFSMVLPRLDPEAGPIAHGKLQKRRDMFWYPVRRLINQMACVGEYVRTGGWPDNVPEVKLIAQVADFEQSQMVKWRAGKKAFKSGDFRWLWRTLSEVRGMETPAAPWPLFVAALLWKDMFVSKQSMLLVDEDYQRHWDWCYNELKAKGCTFGTDPWPTCFNQI